MMLQYNRPVYWPHGTTGRYTGATVRGTMVRQAGILAPRFMALWYDRPVWVALTMSTIQIIFIHYYPLRAATCYTSALRQMP